MTQGLSIGLYTPAWPGSQTANGIASAVHFLAAGLLEAGHRPVIVTPRIDGEDPAKIPVITIGQAWSISEKLKARIGFPNVASQVMGRCIVDAFQAADQVYGLHAIIMEETYGWAGSVQDKFSIPVIATLHGPWFMHKELQSDGDTAYNQHREKQEAVAFLKVAGITAPSQDVMDATLAKIPELKHQNTRVIPNALKFEETFVAASLRTQKILFVGRYDYHKGGDVVLDAFAELAKHNKEVTLTFVGPDRGVRQADGSRVFIRDTLEALPPEIQARIDYQGQQGRSDIQILRKSHPVAVMASRYENLNYTMLEAMAAGQALIATNVGGPGEVLEHGETALLTMPGDVHDLATTMNTLLKSAEIQYRLGKSAQETLKLDFSPLTIAQQSVDFVSDVALRNYNRPG